VSHPLFGVPGASSVAAVAPTPANRVALLVTVRSLESSTFDPQTPQNRWPVATSDLQEEQSTAASYDQVGSSKSEVRSNVGAFGAVNF
jgi:hypothetical protein